MTQTTDTKTSNPVPQSRVIGPRDNDTLGDMNGVRDRFMLEGKEFGAAVSMVEHLMAPKALAAPLHRHSREDEFSYVLEGKVGVHLGGETVFGTVGDLIPKPRGEWHTFWNADDTPARVLELISPGGFEQAFREMHALGQELSPETMAEIAVRYGCEVDFEATGPLMERHGLSF